MILGIPRGVLYYEYISFIRDIFTNTDVKLYEGPENNDEIFEKGTTLTVDEACLPIKLLRGQCEYLTNFCDKILILKIMKDINGCWVCPKILGQEQLLSATVNDEKFLISEPICLNNRRTTYKTLLKMFRKLGIDKSIYKENFIKAYSKLEKQNLGIEPIHVEASWEFIPESPKQGEIILPNTKQILLTGHLYNVYDKYSNKDLIRILDDMAIDALTEKEVSHQDQEASLKKLQLMKTPYWESVIRTLGTAAYLKNQIDGIIYLSSFSCGPDSIIVELIQEHIKNVPLLVLKLDEHKGMAGYLTRIEAFTDLLKGNEI